MMARVAAGAGSALIAAAAALANDKGVTVTTSAPTVWHLLGYAFEAGSMIAALCACLAVRFYVVSKDFPTHRWTLDVPISALALMFTAAAVIRLRPDPIMALFYGTGLGILGAGIIAIAKKNIDRVLAAIGVVDASDEAGIAAAMKKLDKVD